MKQVVNVALQKQAYAYYVKSLTDKSNRGKLVKLQALALALSKIALDSQLVNCRHTVDHNYNLGDLFEILLRDYCLKSHTHKRTVNGMDIRIKDSTGKTVPVEIKFQPVVNSNPEYLGTMGLHCIVWFTGSEFKINYINVVNGHKDLNTVAKSDLKHKIYCHNTVSNTDITVPKIDEFVEMLNSLL